MSCTLNLSQIRKLQIVTNTLCELRCNPQQVILASFGNYDSLEELTNIFQSIYDLNEEIHKMYLDFELGLCGLGEVRRKLNVLRSQLNMFVR
jgi:hypothetical protein